MRTVLWRPCGSVYAAALHKKNDVSKHVVFPGGEWLVESGGLEPSTFRV